MGGAALSLANISKAFDGHVALDRACFEVAWGEVHALLGENGAGKSTLMNIVCGLYTADEGSTSVNEQNVAITGPGDAIRCGIGMVHQHFKLVGPFSVAENILLSCGSKLQIDSTGEAARLAVEAAGRLGFGIDPTARTDELSVAERQRIEIIKLILLGADILILDEPTAVLTDDESETVLSLLREMAAQGKAVVLITHRLREVTRFADRVTIMRGGMVILEGLDATSVKESELAQAMVGEAIHTHGREQIPPEDEHAPVRLDLRNININGAHGTAAVTDLSLQVRAGEILGVAGVGGNGQTELAEAIFGLGDMAGGAIRIDSEDLASLTIKQRRQRGLRLVPADRFSYALLAELRAYENLTLTDVPHNRFGPPWWLSRRDMKNEAERVFADRDITGGTPLTRTRLLSGGNAQKLLLARELNGQTSVLVAHSPTRGLDVRAYETVHETIIACVKTGAACLLISEDLDEIMQLSTRVAVMSRGVLHGPYSMADTNRARIGELMAGHA
ncbi:MAG: ABC transporter ATP-binding protein [Gammaproteobacteria bacterium]